MKASALDNAIDLKGVRIIPGFLEPVEQQELVDEIRSVVRAAPLFHPVTKSGKKMSVRMTSAGSHGWVSDRAGYRYEPCHPQGTPWPTIPKTLLEVWERASGVARPPQCCLINFYGPDARMGLHQDRDEKDFDMPVVSLSLGDDALFRVGGTSRRDPTRSVWLTSGDVAVLSGPSRLAFHGIDRVRVGSSTLLPNGGRINVTLRVVD